MQNPGPAEPAARFVRTWKEVEQLACEWMRYFGFADAELTGDGTDGGIDIRSTGAVAQVKAEMKGKTGRPVVQQLYGVACAERKEGVVFSLAGYTPDAVEWATRVGVALFEFGDDGRAAALTPSAEVVVARARQPVVTPARPVKLVSLPPAPVDIRGTVDGVPAFFGVLLAVRTSPRERDYLRLIVRTGRVCPDVIQRPDWDIDWFTERMLGSWGVDVVSPYVRDRVIANGCSIGIKTSDLPALFGMRHGLDPASICRLAGWFFIKGGRRTWDMPEARPSLGFAVAQG